MRGRYREPQRVRNACSGNNNLIRDRLPSGLRFRRPVGTAGGVKSVDLHEASGHGGSIHATGVGVACNDAHAGHGKWKAISRRSERIGGRFVETQEIEPPEAPA